MKFSDLNSASRSILAALCATSGAGLRTDELGRCAMPKMDPQGAASVLLGLREKGLVFSNQKPANHAYALWKASEYGHAVFQGRPADVPAVPVAQMQADNGCARAAQVKQYRIVPDDGSIGTNFEGTEQEFLHKLGLHANARPGVKYSGYVKMAQAVLPVPTAQVTLL